MVDTDRGVIGEFRGMVGGKYCLRPIGGGREWEISPQCARLATDRDRANPLLAPRGAYWRDGGSR